MRGLQFPCWSPEDTSVRRPVSRDLEEARRRAMSMWLRRALRGTALSLQRKLWGWSVSALFGTARRSCRREAGGENTGDEDRGSGVNCVGLCTSLDRLAFLFWLRWTAVIRFWPEEWHDMIYSERITVAEPLRIYWKRRQKWKWGDQSGCYNSPGEMWQGLDQGRRHGGDGKWSDSGPV